MEEKERPPIRLFLDMLVDLLAERYLERTGSRTRRIPELRRLLTAKEASQYLSLSTETIYRMAARKKLPYLKIGDRVLFDIKALDQWIEKHLVREKGWKKQEVSNEGEKGRANSRLSEEADLLDLLRRKRRG